MLFGEDVGVEVRHPQLTLLRHMQVLSAARKYGVTTDQKNFGYAALSAAELL